MMIRFLIASFVAAALIAPVRPETGQLHLGVQRGMTYLPWIVIQHAPFVAQRAAAAGIPGLKRTLNHLHGGPAVPPGWLLYPHPAARSRAAVGLLGAAGAPSEPSGGARPRPRVDSQERVGGHGRRRVVELDARRATR